MSKKEKLAPSCPVIKANPQTLEMLDTMMFYEKLVWNLTVTQSKLATYFRSIFPLHVIWNEKLRVRYDKEAKQHVITQMTDEGLKDITLSDLPMPILQVEEDERIFMSVMGIKSKKSPCAIRFQKQAGTTKNGKVKWEYTDKYDELAGKLLGNEGTIDCTKADYTTLQRESDIQRFLPHTGGTTLVVQEMLRKFEGGYKAFLSHIRNGNFDAEPPGYKRAINFIELTSNHKPELEFREHSGYGRLHFNLMGQTHTLKFRGFPEYMRDATLTSAGITRARNGALSVKLVIDAEDKPKDPTILQGGMVCALDWGMKNDAFLTVKLTNASPEAREGFLDDLTANEFEWQPIAEHTMAYEIFHPRYMRSADIEDKLIYLQQQLSNKVGAKKGEKWSKSYRRIQKKINKEYARVKARRDDWIQKLTKILVRHFHEVITETIDWKGMKEQHNEDKNLRINTRKKMSDMAPSKFFTLLESKARQHGKTYIEIQTGKKTAPSQQCSVCRTKNPTMKDTKQRLFTCKDASCGYVCHRDINACQNMLIEGGYSGLVILHQDRHELEKRLERVKKDQYYA